MALSSPKSLQDLERGKFVEAAGVTGQPAVVVSNPDGSAIGAGGKYNATLPTYNNGDTVTAQYDVNGRAIVTLGTQIAGEDLTNDVIKVERRYTNAAISTATTTVVKSGAGFVNKIICVGGTLGNVTIYDNTAASGTVLCPTATPVQNGVLLENITFGTGLTVVTAAATVLTISYR